MWLKFIVFVVVLFVNNVRTQKGDCFMSDEDGWSTAIRFDVDSTDEPGKEDKKKVEHIIGCTLDLEYVDCTIDKSKENVVFTLTDAFVGYVEKETNIQIGKDIEFKCSNGGSVIKKFRFVVDQKIFYPPEFIEDEYEFNLKMPLAPSTEISDTEIQINDINLGDQKGNLQFTLSKECNGNFEMGTIRADGKRYRTNLKTLNKVVNLNQDVNCQLTVENKNTQGKVNSANILLKVDPIESIPPNPVFEKPVYVADLQENNKIKPLEIKLVNEVFKPTITYSSDAAEYESFFDFDDSTMTFLSKESLPDSAFEERNFITFTIIATYEKAELPGKTIVIINPPLKDGIDIIPEFESLLYVAQYINPNEVEHQPIILKSEGKAEYNIISADFSDYFKFDDATNKLIVTNLPENVFKNDDYISIIIEATYDDVPLTGKTVVYINGPKKILPAFEQDVYEAEFVSETEIKHDLIILNNEKHAEPIIELHSVYKEHFVFNKGQLLIKQENPLPSSAFNDKNFIFVTIEAKYDTEGISSKTVIIINAPVEIPIAEFEKDVYEAQYEGEKEIHIDQFILKNNNENYKVKYTFSSEIKDLEEHFEVVENKLTINKKLPDNLFNSKNFVSLTVLATYEGSLLSGRTIVIINGPKNELSAPPVFKEAYYHAKYVNPNTIKHAEIILIADESLEVEFNIISAEFETHFEFDNIKHELLIKKPIPESEFDKRHFISVTIEAKYKGATKSGYTVVVIESPKSPDDSKPKVYYDKQVEVIVEDPPIAIGTIIGTFTATSDILDEEIIYSIATSDISNKFEYSKNGELKVKESLSDTRYIYEITLQAEGQESKSKATRSVILIVNHESTSPKVYYDKLVEVIVEDPPIAIGTIIGTFTATSDILDEEIIYSIATSDISNKFEYTKKGELKVKEILSDTRYIYEITLQAEGQESKSKATRSVILILNHDSIPPKVHYDKQVEVIVEDPPIAIGTIIGTFTATSDILDEEIIYSIATSDISNKFEYTKKGELKVKEILSDTRYIYEITLQAEGQESKSKATRSVILIVNHDSIPLKVHYDKQVEVIVEDPPIAIGTIIGTFTATSDILDEEIIYSIATSDISNKFEYTKQGELKVKESLSDTKYIYEITLQAEGQESKSKATKSVILIVNHESTSLKVYYDEQVEVIVENPPISIGTIIGTFTATSDILDEEIIYSIATSDISNTFEYSKNGELKVKESLSDTRYIYEITLQAEGQESKSKATRSVILIVNHESTSPKVYYDKLVEVIVEDPPIAIGTIIGTFTATSDILDEEIIYSIATSDISNKFEYTKKGELKVKEILSDTRYIYEITLQAEGQESKSKATRSVILILNHDSIPPKVHYDKQVEVIVEDPPIAIGTIIGTFTATSDILDEEIIYSIATSDISNKFEYTKKGELKVKEILSDTRYIYEITLQAEGQESKSKATRSVILILNHDSIPPKVHYDKQVEVIVEDPPIAIGTIIGTFTATSDILDEEIIYSIATSDISNKFEYTKNGELKLKESLSGTKYTYEIMLYAKGQKSNSIATMSVILIVNKGFIFENSLDIRTILEDSQQTLIVEKIENYELLIDNKDWFQIDKNNVYLKPNIDREDPKFKDMMIVQVKTQVQAVEKSSYQSSFKNLIFNVKEESNTQGSCIDISSIPVSADTMEVVVIIGDINDNYPKFVEPNPLIIGYPSSELINYIAPPYLVKVTATDADFGENAIIRYSVNKDFIIDPKNGIIYPGEDLSSDTEFVVTATDRDGAKDGLESTLNVKVKILKEEHITVLTVNDITYSEVDNFIARLSSETKTTVKYLSSSALPRPDGSSEEESVEDDDKTFRRNREDDKIPVLRIVTYALDKEKVVLADDFKNLLEESNMEESIEAIAYATTVREPEEADNSGWIAAVSTLSALLALVIIAVIAAYIFYIRPKLVGGPVKYKKHKNRESTYSTPAPVETKINETRVADRRLTGFSVGFTPKDLDEEDEVDNVKDEKNEDENDDVFTVENEYVEPVTERKKSVVKFDQNVTEIEISEL